MISIKVEIAPGGDPSASPDSLSWVDITDYAKARIRITRGRQDEQSQTQPSRCALRLDNAGGRFVTRNPIAPWYPQLRRNCPIRVSVLVGGTWHERFTGYVDAWPIRWASGETVSYVDVTASGITRRLTRGDAPSGSALYRYITELPWVLLAYWPCEDGSDARSAASAVGSVSSMSVSGSVRFGQAAPLSGVSSLVNPSGGDLRGWIPRHISTSWTVEGVALFDAIPATNVRTASWLTPGTLGAWNLRCDASGWHLDGYTAVIGGAKVLQIDSASVPVPGQLHHLRVDVSTTAGTLTATLYVGGVSVGSDTVASASTNPPWHLRLNPDHADADVASTGHWAVWSGNPVSDSVDVALGHLGQHAHVRIEEVCADAGIPVSPVYGGSVSSEPLGPQPLGSLIGILRDAEAADGGILYERTSGELSYLRREAMYNLPVSMALGYRQLAPPLEPVDDDQLLVNDITVRRPGGSAARYVDERHVAGEGRYEDSADTNVRFDARLANHAAWRVRRGTVDDLRYPAITLNLLGGAAPLVSSWLACDIGSRITVDDLPVELPPDPLDLLLDGYTETLDAFEWTATLNCSPYAPHVVGVREDPVLGRRDTAGSELAAAVSSSATSLLVTTTLGPMWTTDAGQFPFDIGVGGERMTVGDGTGGTVTENFEDATLNVTITGTWARASGTAHTGTWSLKSATIGHSAQTDAVVTVPAGATSMTFWYKISSESGFDWVRFFLDGVQYFVETPTSGEHDWQRITVDVTGVSAVTFRYVKDSGVVGGSDAAWIDDLSFTIPPISAGITSSVRDTFGRTTSNGWGTADSGQVWSTTGGVSADYLVSAGTGRHSLNVVTAPRLTTIGSATDVDVITHVRSEKLANAAPILAMLVGRYVDASNYYYARLSFEVGAAINLQLYSVVAGSFTALTSATSTGLTHTSTGWYGMRLQVVGSTLRAKAWDTATAEPSDWLLTATDALVTGAGSFGMRSQLLTGNTNTLPVVIQYDNFEVLHPQTFNVTRSVNGVVKAHAAGTAVSLWTPARRAL